MKEEIITVRELDRKDISDEFISLSYPRDLPSGYTDSLFGFGYNLSNFYLQLTTDNYTDTDLLELHLNSVIYTIALKSLGTRICNNEYMYKACLVSTDFNAFIPDFYESEKVTLLHPVFVNRKYKVTYELLVE